MDRTDSAATHLIPDDLAEVYEGLRREIQWLQAKWQIFCQLFVVSEEQTYLLNRKAPGFFRIVYGVLLDDVFMSLSRLIDPARTGPKENLCLARLIELIGASDNPEFYREIGDMQERIRSHCEPFRKRRNRTLAHSDLSTSLENHADPLPGISIRMIKEGLQMVRDLMNCIEDQFDLPRILYEDPIIRGDGKTLVACLREAEERGTAQDASLEIG